MLWNHLFIFFIYSNFINNIITHLVYHIFQNITLIYGFLSFISFLPSCGMLQKQKCDDNGIILLGLFVDI